MKDAIFQELLQGIREGGGYLRGESKPGRVVRVRAPDRARSSVSPKPALRRSAARLSAKSKPAPRRVRAG